MKFSTNDFFNKCDQIRSFLRIWSHLLRKSLLENFIFCAVYIAASFIYSQFELKYVLQRCNSFCLFNPFASNAPFLQLLKTSEKLTVF